MTDPVRTAAVYATPQIHCEHLVCMYNLHVLLVDSQEEHVPICVPMDPLVSHPFKKPQSTGAYSQLSLQSMDPTC